MNFNDYCWHDAIVKNILIDRSNPGINDSIHLDVMWSDRTRSRITFEEVYLAKFNLNFGVISTENILNAKIANSDNEDLSNLYLKWKGLLDNIILNCYVINLNSTGGEIKIISKDCKILDSK
jgi:hypothetical protein